MRKKLFTIIMSLALMVTMMPAMTLTANADGEDPYLSQPLCFTAEEDGITVALTKGDGAPDASFKYSQNNSDWYNYVPETPITINNGDSVYFKAQNENSSLGNDSGRWQFSTAENTGNEEGIVVSGNILSLLYSDFANKSSSQLPEFVFRELFSETTIKDVSHLKLPSTTLAKWCYYYMFSNCNYLKNAPELTANNLAEYCYGNMFSGCNKLEIAPALPATKLAVECYSEMFKGCEKLVNAPVLPATSLADYCYRSMFDECLSLTDAPKLPATKLATNCYQSMFYHCESLINPPILPATELAVGCYVGMFSDCKKLERTPELPAKALKNACYGYMFYDCSSLNEVSVRFGSEYVTTEFLDTWLEGVAATGTFYGPASLENSGVVPDGWDFIEIKEEPKIKLKGVVAIVAAITAVAVVAKAVCANKCATSSYGCCKMPFASVCANPFVQYYANPFMKYCAKTGSFGSGRTAFKANFPWQLFSFTNGKSFVFPWMM